MNARLSCLPSGTMSLTGEVCSPPRGKCLDCRGEDGKGIPKQSLFQCKFEFPHKRFLLADFGGSHFSTLFHDYWERLVNHPAAGTLLHGLCETSPPGNAGNSADLCTGGEWLYQLGGFASHAFLPSWRQVGLNFLRERWCLFWVSNQLIVSSQLSAIPPSRYAMEDVGMFMHWALGYSHDFAFHKRRGRILVQEAVAFVCVFSDSCMRNTMST